MVVCEILCLHRLLNRHFQSYQNCMDSFFDNALFPIRQHAYSLSIFPAALSVRREFLGFRVLCDRPLPLTLYDDEKRYKNTKINCRTKRARWLRTILLLSILFTFSFSSFLFLLFPYFFLMFLLLILLDPLLFLLHANTYKIHRINWKFTIIIANGQINNSDSPKRFCAISPPFLVQLLRVAFGFVSIFRRVSFSFHRQLPA